MAWQFWRDWGMLLTGAIATRGDRGLVRHQSSIPARAGTVDSPPLPLDQNRRDLSRLNLDLRGKIVYDIGAKDGSTTLFFSRWARQVVAYEIVPTNLRTLTDRLKVNGITNVVVRPIPLGQKGWSVAIKSDAISNAGITDKALDKMTRSQGYVSIPATTLDEDIASNHLPYPNFIKLDCEGFEIPVLAGMASTMELARPCLLIRLQGSTPLAVRNLTAILSLLADSGYTAMHLESKQRITQAAHDFTDGHLLAVFQSESFPFLEVDGRLNP